MIGRRIQHVDGQDPYHELTRLGDYTLITGGKYAHDGRPSVYFILPVAGPWQSDPIDGVYTTDVKHLASCAMPPHVFRECPDGSLEIRESLLVTRRWKGKEWQWHGYLDEGHVWRTV